MADASLSIQCRVCEQFQARKAFYTRKKSAGREVNRIVQPCKKCFNNQSVERARQSRLQNRLTRPPQFCACGCGETIPHNKSIRYKHDHQREKPCIRCGEIKPIEQFGLGSARQRANGEIRRYREPLCRSCKNQRERSNPGVRARKAAYQRQYVKTPKGRVLKRLNRQKHLDKHNANSRQWAEANPEKRRLSTRICEQKRRLEKGWNLKSPEIRAAIEQTLELARIGSQYLDAYTGELIDKPTIDHIVPISMGGTNNADNLCVTSLSNNSSKFNDSLLIWFLKRAQQSRNF